MNAIWAPFGFLDVRNEAEPPVLPPDWFVPAGLHADWRHALECNADEIGKNIWPWWDQENCCWSDVGISMYDASSLALADVVICRELAGLLTTPPVSGGHSTHLDCFRGEDIDGLAAPSVYEYLKSTGVSADFSAHAQEAGKRLESLTFAFKRRFRRPRPYNAALVLGLSKFPWEYAKSSLHASLISGHGAQGMLGVAAAWLLETAEARETSRARAMQLAVDFGDRRVMAGVHYPSDNFASWVTVTRYTKHYALWARSQKLDALDFIESAILQHSTVYALCRHAESRARFDHLSDWLARVFDEERAACSHALDA